MGMAIVMKSRTWLFLAVVLAFTYVLFTLVPYYWIFIATNFIFMYSAVTYILMYLEACKLPAPSAPKRWPSMSVVIPSYNSAATIEGCLRAVKAMRYPKPLEVIVVDDGSTDGTYEKAKAFEGVEVISRKYNKGKAASLNEAIAVAKGELVACIDSDTYPEADVLEKIVPHFNDARVASTTALICVRNPRNILQRLQEIEYYIAFGFCDKCLSLFDGLIITPGPMSVYRKAALDEIGGFDETNITEDMEIALHLQERGYKIGACVDAKVYTDVPASMHGLFRQRVRWYRGKLVNGRKYSHMLLNPKFADIGMFVFPYSFVIEIASLILAGRAALFWLGDISSKVSEAAAWASISAVPRFSFSTDPLMMQSLFFFFLVSALVWGFMVWSAFSISREKIRLAHVPILPMFVLFYYMFTATAYFVGVVREVNGSPYKW